MADKRIYELTDTQTSYSTGIYAQVDNAGFSNTKKMDISTIYPLINVLVESTDINPATATIRIDPSDSGSEQKMTVQNMIEDSDVADIIENLNDTGWKTYAVGDITKNSAKVDANLFNASVRSRLGIIVLTGAIRLTSQASQDEILFTLPSSIPTPTDDIYFPVCDSNASASDENYEFYIQSGSRAIRSFNGNGSSGQQGVFSVTYFGG